MTDEPQYPPLNVPMNPLAMLYGALVMGLVWAVEALFDLEERAHLDHHVEEEVGG